MSTVPKSVELEQRLARVEIQQEHIREVLELLLKRLASLQAQLDHLDARVGRLS